MNKKNTTLMCLSLICYISVLAQTVSSQNESGSKINKADQFATSSDNFIYTDTIFKWAGLRNEIVTNVSENFIIADTTIRLNDDKLKHLREGFNLRRSTTIIESGDGQFIGFFEMIPMLPSLKDSLDMVRRLKKANAIDPVSCPDTTYYPSLLHWGNIKRDLIYSLNIDKKEPINIHDYVTYYSHRKAQKMFNVDSLITYPIHFDMEYIYKDKYTTCQTWFLLKKDIGFIKIYGLFTDKGAKKKDYYLKLLQKSIRFKEE